MPRRRKVVETVTLADDEEMDVEMEPEPVRRSTRTRTKPSSSSTVTETTPTKSPVASTSRSKRGQSTVTSAAASVSASEVKTESVEKSACFLATLHKYQQEALFCDAALKSSDGGLVMTHACVVAAACPFLYHELIDCKPSYFTVETSIPPDLLNHLVDFIYSGKVSLSPEQVDELMDCGDILGLNLHNYCSPDAVDPQQVQLYDPNWASSLFAIMRQFQKSGVFCDAELKSAVDGGVFTAHTCVIAASKNILCEELTATGFFPANKLNKIAREVA